MVVVQNADSPPVLKRFYFYYDESNMQCTPDRLLETQREY